MPKPRRKVHRLVKVADDDEIFGASDPGSLTTGERGLLGMAGVCMYVCMHVCMHVSRFGRSRIRCHCGMYVCMYVCICLCVI